MNIISIYKFNLSITWYLKSKSWKGNKPNRFWYNEAYCNEIKRLPPYHVRGWKKLCLLVQKNTRKHSSFLIRNFSQTWAPVYLRCQTVTRKNNGFNQNGFQFRLERVWLLLKENKFNDWQKSKQKVKKYNGVNKKCHLYRCHHNWKLVVYQIVKCMIFKLLSYHREVNFFSRFSLLNSLM